MSKGIRNALIIGGGIVLAVVLLIVYMYLPVDGLQYSAGKYSTGSNVPSQDENPTLDTDADKYVFDCEIIYASLSVLPGEQAIVKVQGRENVKYSIEVIYSSGPSTAKELEDKIADADGYVEWSWTVSSNVIPGIYKIYVKSETGESAFAWIEVRE